MKKNAIVISLVCAAGFVFALSLSAWKASAENRQANRVDPSGQFVRGRLLVKFHDRIDAQHGRQIIAALGARDADEIKGIGVHVLDLPDQANEQAYIRAFQARPEVEFAELDRIVWPDEVTPNDPWYIDQWHLKKIGTPAAWSSTTGGPNIIVAILDGGVDGSHPDLAANMVAGWNTYNNSSDTSDPAGHGTKVAGSAVAASNNSVGVAGVAWGCKIMPVRIADATGATTFSAMASGLNWAANHGARVANISYSPITDSSTVTSAAKYFQSQGGVVISSAGNTGSFVATADSPYILTVSATDANDVRSSSSSTGNNVDLAAPGISIRTTARGGTYAAVSGTSFSAPIVAGVAALVMTANSSLTGAEVQDILEQSADDLGATGWDTTYGSGRVNAARALAMAGGGNNVDSTPPTVSITSPSHGSTVAGGVNVAVSASDNVGVSSISLAIDGAPFAVDGSSPYSFQWDTSAVANGQHVLTATAIDAAGQTSSFSVSVIVGNVVIADNVAPTVTIVEPAVGSTISSSVSVSVSVSDNVGVVKNELYVDGVLTASSTSAPFSLKWNSRKAKAGAHVLLCKAYDAAGNVGSSQAVNVFK